MKFRASIQKYFVAHLILSYALFTLGLISAFTRLTFINLTPYLLGYTFILVFYEELRWIKKMPFTLIAIGILSFFGEYILLAMKGSFYSNMLGFKYLGVPIVLLINWIVISISARSLVNLIGLSKRLTIVLSALVMGVYYFIFIPVSIRLGWLYSAGPDLISYLSWLGFMFLFQIMFIKVPVKTGRSFWVIILHIVLFNILAVI